MEIPFLEGLFCMVPSESGFAAVVSSTFFDLFAFSSLLLVSLGLLSLNFFEHFFYFFLAPSNHCGYTVGSSSSASVPTKFT